MRKSEENEWKCEETRGNVRKCEEMRGNVRKCGGDGGDIVVVVLSCIGHCTATHTHTHTLHSLSHTPELPSLSPHDLQS